MSAGLPHDAPTERRLDETDRRIVERLQVDGRVPHAVLGDELGLEPGEVRRRVEALRAADVINIVAVTDPLRLGYPRMALLGLVVDGDARTVAETLTRFEQVVYLARTMGGFDLIAEVVGTSDANLLELVTRVRRLAQVTRIHTFLYSEVVKESYTYGTA